MSARWLEQKLQKQKRMKRAYLKHKRTFGVDVPKIVAYDIFQNKARTKIKFVESIVEGKVIKEPITLFSLYDKDKNGKSLRGWEPRANSPTRQDAVDKKHQEIEEEYKRLHRSFLLDALYEVWQGKNHQGVRKYHEVKLKPYVTLYFSGNEFIFVQSYEGVRWISRTYQGRDIAMMRFDNTYLDGTGYQRIEWVIEEPINQQ